ncbi:hypothetical protein SAY87_013468 [Trapa incisa]|uniref:AT-rich interactive domain-containing protein 3 n=1 Tax=Trapa incisa TaxID=236973 RepID=A0AAN7QG42_9MYRT|nr:hypothetical protein SAY87_013468 [Trapa incisa]
MSDAQEKKEAGLNLAPEQTPVEVAEPGGGHVEAFKEESSKARTKEENTNLLQNGCTPVVGTGADGKQNEIVSCNVKPLPQEAAALVSSEHGEDLDMDLNQHVQSAVVLDGKAVTNAMPTQEINEGGDSNISLTKPGTAKTIDNTIEDAKKTESKTVEGLSGVNPVDHETTNMFGVVSADVKGGNIDGEQMEIKDQEIVTPLPKDKQTLSLKDIFLLDENGEGSESGTEEEQSAFMKELENFFKEKSMEFKPPKFYGEGLNCLKLWRAVIRLGGYDKVTSCKLWRQVGEAFKPPKTCTTVSWTFRGFYEKALLDYERDKIHGGDIGSIASPTEPMSADNQASGSNRARRDAAARAMQGWYSQRLFTNGEVSDPIIKDKSAKSLQKHEKQLKSGGSLKRKKSPYMENPAKTAHNRSSELKLDVVVVDAGPPADWVKINVQRTKDCFEVYALVPGLLREEVRVQSDPAGRLVISGEPEHPENPWGVTPFKKVVNLPSRIDPHQTSAVVTLHGQLFVRVPFEQAE